MDLEELQNRKTLRPVAGLPCDLTVIELSEIWQTASLKYMLVGYVREFLAEVNKDIPDAPKDNIKKTAVAYAKAWEKDRAMFQKKCSALDKALEAARIWIITAARRPRGLDGTMHQLRPDSLWAFNNTVTSSIVELVEETAF